MQDTTKTAPLRSEAGPSNTTVQDTPKKLPQPKQQDPIVQTITLTERALKELMKSFAVTLAQIWEKPIEAHHVTQIDSALDSILQNTTKESTGTKQKHTGTKTSPPVSQSNTVNHPLQETLALAPPNAQSPHKPTRQWTEQQETTQMTDQTTEPTLIEMIDTFSVELGYTTEFPGLNEQPASRDPRLAKFK